MWSEPLVIRDKVSVCEVDGGYLPSCLEINDNNIAEEFENHFYDEHHDDNGNYKGTYEITIRKIK